MEEEEAAAAAAEAEAAAAAAALEEQEEREREDRLMRLREGGGGYQPRRSNHNGRLGRSPSLSRGASLRCRNSLVFRSLQVRTRGGRQRCFTVNAVCAGERALQTGLVQLKRSEL